MARCSSQSQECLRWKFSTSTKKCWFFRAVSKNKATRFPLKWVTMLFRISQNTLLRVFQRFPFNLNSNPATEVNATAFYLALSSQVWHFPLPCPNLRSHQTRNRVDNTQFVVTSSQENTVGRNTVRKKRVYCTPLPRKDWTTVFESTTDKMKHCFESFSKLCLIVGLRALVDNICANKKVLGRGKYVKGRPWPRCNDDFAQPW